MNAAPPTAGRGAGRVERWLFAPTDPFALGLCRASTCGLLFLLYLPVDFGAWAAVDPVFWMPQGVPFRLGLGLPSAPVLAAMGAAWKIALAGAALGVATRLCLTTCFVLGVVLLWVPHNFGKLHHHDAILPFVFGILAFADSGGAFSIDARLRRGPRPVPSGEYRWPILAVRTVLAVVFFTAGLSKLRNGAPAWLLEDQLQSIFVKESLTGDPVGELGLRLAGHAAVCRVLAIGTVLLELGYPLALFHRGARRWFVPGMFAAQIGIRITMGPAFWTFLICNVFWVPWNELRERWRRGPVPARAGAAQASA